MDDETMESLVKMIEDHEQSQGRGNLARQHIWKGVDTSRQQFRAVIPERSQVAPPGCRGYASQSTIPPSMAFFNGQTLRELQYPSASTAQSSIQGSTNMQSHLQADVNYSELSAMSQQFVRDPQNPTESQSFAEDYGSWNLFPGLGHLEETQPHEQEGNFGAMAMTMDPNDVLFESEMDNVL